MINAKVFVSVLLIVDASKMPVRASVGYVDTSERSILRAVPLAQKFVEKAPNWPSPLKHDQLYTAYWADLRLGALRGQFISSSIIAAFNIRSFRRSRVVIFRHQEYQAIADGGCNVVNLIFYGPSDSRNTLRCGAN